MFLKILFHFIQSLNLYLFTKHLPCTRHCMTQQGAKEHMVPASMLLMVSLGNSSQGFS